MKLMWRVLVASVLIGLLAGGGAWGDTTNYWTTNSVGSYNGTMNTAPGNWSLGTAPTGTEQVWFTNQQSAPYTNQLSASITTSALKVYDDSVVYDLNGYAWTVNWSVGNHSVIGTNPTYEMTVKFSSSSPTNVANGNLYDNSAGTSSAYAYMGSDSAASGRNTHIIIDDSLGYPVKVRYSFGFGTMRPGTDVLVSGPGSEFDVAYIRGGLNGNVLVTNGATLRFTQLRYEGRSGIGSYGSPGYYYTTVTVANASIYSPGLGVGGSYGAPTLILRDGSTWYDSGDVGVGLEANTPTPYAGTVVIDDSTLYGQGMTLGGSSSHGQAPGLLVVTNQGTATFSNRLVTTANTKSGVRSTLVLNNGTITLGGGATPGVLTNLGAMRAAGTIRGLGNSPATIYGGTGSVFAVGSSIGTLVLSNVDLTLAAGSSNVWEFSDSGLDQVILTDGAASIGGTNVFALAAGATAPVAGSSYGLGMYDFVLGSNVAWNSQWDNLTNVLAGYGLVQNLDYQFGVVDVGGGQQALRLQFVPEPSTLLLLLVGGLLLRRLARKT